MGNRSIWNLIQNRLRRGCTERPEDPREKKVKRKKVLERGIGVSQTGLVPLCATESLLLLAPQQIVPQNPGCPSPNCARWVCHTMYVPQATVWHRILAPSCPSPNCARWVWVCHTTYVLQCALQNVFQLTTLGHRHSKAKSKCQALENVAKLYQSV